VPLVLGYVLNVYAAVGAMTALHLSAQQITVLVWPSSSATTCWSKAPCCARPA